MNGQDLLQVLEKDQNVLRNITGIFCIDQIIETLDENCFMIINTSTAQQEGSHWISASKIHNEIEVN